MCWEITHQVFTESLTTALSVAHLQGCVLSAVAKTESYEIPFLYVIGNNGSFRMNNIYVSWCIIIGIPREETRKTTFYFWLFNWNLLKVTNSIICTQSFALSKILSWFVAFYYISLQCTYTVMQTTLPLTTHLNFKM